MPCAGRPEGVSSAIVNHDHFFHLIEKKGRGAYTAGQSFRRQFGHSEGDIKFAVDDQTRL